MENLFVYEVRRTGSEKRPWEVWRLAENPRPGFAPGWVVFASKSEESAKKRAAEMNRNPV